MTFNSCNISVIIKKIDTYNGIFNKMVYFCKDPDIFVWNNNFAYGVGLIATDGCLSPDKRHIEFSSKDLGLVLNIKKSFGLRNKIGLKKRGPFPNTKYFRVQFGNVKLYDFLVKIGLSSCKSHTLSSLRIPKDFFADFLRGVIDGDGSIGFFMHPESRQKQFRIRITSASKKFLEWIQEEIFNFLNLKGTIKWSQRAYQLCYYKESSRKICNFVYYKKNSLFLERKFDTAKLIITRAW